MQYCHKLDLRDNARMALNYLTSMVDPELDYLPYWLISIHVTPPFARHCRVDDAELVASWYEAITAVRRVFGFEEGAEVQAGFKRHLLKSWGPEGLRYHEDYPWTDSLHSSFHEMAYILAALNRSIEEDDTHPQEVRRRAHDLVEGMRGLVIERRTLAFWGGDTPLPPDRWEYEFPNDVYFLDRKWDMTCHTGRGEQAIRNAMMLHPLTHYYELTGHETALDLARGLARHLLGTSRYFNHRGEFFGHVHSAVWVARGLALLGQITGEEQYVTHAGNILEYVLGLSSSFGWVPEYAQWHPHHSEHCETCCINDVIQCALQLSESGRDYWDVVNRFARNQLIENQIRDGSFLEGTVDNSREDTRSTTWHGLDRRIVGGFSGGSEPNSISLQRFRSVAGCCAGMAPQALATVYERSIERDGGAVWINLPIDRRSPDADVSTGYPDDGSIHVEVKNNCDLYIRTAEWMGPITIAVNGKDVPLLRCGNAAKIPGVSDGDRVSLQHPIQTSVRSETVRGVHYKVHWRGPDVVRLAPAGLPLRLYVRTQPEKDDVAAELAERRKASGHQVAPTKGA